LAIQSDQQNQAATLPFGGCGVLGHQLMDDVHLSQALSMIVPQALNSFAIGTVADGGELVWH
jgi:hypothetical protein